ncbi:hypothetical protein BHE74_00055708 [Ensete ventricosum]|uniref:Uncharacterized protein n=1 Tax=Ensete ventricosum TaxID=4639 RepID=A0A426ZHT1_ENSVE|nr:hypothetical protein B296_00022486 [Ensete ventricosum]RWW39001.1 hypothetical protein BHE74_00055708 [Ensete ventricosum]
MAWISAYRWKSQRVNRSGGEDHCFEYRYTSMYQCFSKEEKEGEEEGVVQELRKQEEEEVVKEEEEEGRRGEATTAYLGSSEVAVATLNAST